MYNITELRNGKWYCQYRIQDGTEDFTEPTRKKAVQGMISAARTMNNMYITEKDISFFIEGPPPPLPQMTAAQQELLSLIGTGRKVIIDYDDKRNKYRITDKECDMIVKIREGNLVVRRAKK